MQTQDAPAEFIFKLWPWLEANKNRLIGALVGIIVIAGIWYFVSAQREAREVTAGEALSTVELAPPAGTTPSQLAASYEQLAATYAGTSTGKRAQLQAAGALFAAGNYAEAQAQFQKSLDADSTGIFAPTAELGLAACQEAQNKTDLAAAAYQRVISAFPSSPYSIQAEFGLGRIADEQGKAADAISHYEKVATGAIGGTIAQEAQMRLTELKIKLATAAAAQSAAAPKTLSTPPAAAAPVATPKP
jgi:predicted negative regulator of RcsB-dependent stress response